MTATPSTYGAKYTARKRFRPANFPFSTMATASGTTRSNGAASTVKSRVLRRASQKTEAHGELPLIRLV